MVHPQNVYDRRGAREEVFLRIFPCESGYLRGFLPKVVEKTHFYSVALRLQTGSIGSSFCGQVLQKAVKVTVWDVLLDVY